MNIGDKASLTAKIQPANASDPSLKWTSSDHYTAAVDQNGQVTAGQAGTAYLYATASNGVSAKCKVTVSGPVPSATAPSSPASAASPAPKAFYGGAFSGSSQVVVVTAKSLNTIYASLSTYQNSGGAWHNVLNADARVGKYGLVYDNVRIEGDLRTPIGVYSLPYAFGTAPNPGSKLRYQPVDTNTYYDGQYGSPTYNALVEGKPDNSEWEYMYVSAYQYGVDINFNPEQKPGKGNGIFLHCSTASGYTAGCVSVSPDNMVKILQWLDPAQNPKIVICLEKELPNYYH